MGHHEDGPPVSPQILFQPCDHLPVQMVRGLVQEKHVKIPGKCLCQDDPALLSAGKVLDLLIQIRDPKLRQIALHLPVLPVPFRQSIGADIRSFRKNRILRDIGDLKPVLPDDLTLVGRLLPCYHPEQGRFSRTVDPYDADLISLLDAERGVFVYGLFAVDLADMFNIDDIHKIKLLTNPSVASYCSTEIF